MTDDAEDRRAAARKAVWDLVREQPGLQDLLNLGGLVAHHRHLARPGSGRFWVIDWEGVLQEVKLVSERRANVE